MEEKFSILKTLIVFVSLAFASSTDLEKVDLVVFKLITAGVHDVLVDEIVLRVTSLHHSELRLE